MLPTVIVLLLVVLAVVAVIWVVRRAPPHVARPGEDQDTAWNDPITPADTTDETPHSALAPHKERP